MKNLHFIKIGLATELNPTLNQTYLKAFVADDSSIPYFIINADYLFIVRRDSDKDTGSHKSFTCSVYPLEVIEGINSNTKHYAPANALPRMHAVQFGLSKYVRQYENATEFNSEVVGLMASYAGDIEEKLWDKKGPKDVLTRRTLEQFHCNLLHDESNPNYDTFKDQSMTVIPVHPKVRQNGGGYNPICTYDHFQWSDVPRLCWNIFHAVREVSYTEAIDMAAYYQNEYPGDPYSHELELKAGSLAYVGTGETYDKTLCFNYATGKFRVAAWGDILEKDESRYPGFHKSGRN